MLTYRLISFARERDPLSILHALLHMDFQYFLFLNNLLTLTLRAAVLVINGLTGTLALIAWMLHLLNHGGSEVSNRDFHSRPLATRTLHWSTWLWPFTASFHKHPHIRNLNTERNKRWAQVCIIKYQPLAFGADYVARKRKLLGCPITKIFQGNFKGMDHILSPSLPTASAAATSWAHSIKTLTSSLRKYKEHSFT